jgi:hypothetical protein
MWYAHTRLGGTVGKSLIALTVAIALMSALGAAQLLPPPHDGDIRTAYWELQNVTDIWLTLEPRTVKGDRAPLLTFTLRFTGKRQAVAAREVEVRAFAGQFWAPRAELWFDLNGKARVDVSPGAPAVSLLPGAADDYWGGEISVDVINRMARAQHVRGSALGFPFELTASQRQALATWLDRIAPGSVPPSGAATSTRRS